MRSPPPHRTYSRREGVGMFHRPPCFRTT
jgi:hypothetical protein